MSIDMSTPFDFLKTMRLSDYEHTDDFFADFHEQLGLYAIDKNNKIKALEEKLRGYESDFRELRNMHGERFVELTEAKEKLQSAEADVKVQMHLKCVAEEKLRLSEAVIENLRGTKSAMSDVIEYKSGRIIELESALADERTAKTVLEEKLRETEKERMEAACARNAAEFKLAIATEALEKINEPDVVWINKAKDIADEALAKIKVNGSLYSENKEAKHE